MGKLDPISSLSAMKKRILISIIITNFLLIVLIFLKYLTAHVKFGTFQKFGQTSLPLSRREIAFHIPP